VPHARRRIIQLHKSALQPSLAKPFAETGRKVVPTLSWIGAVTKMAFEPGETDMRDMHCRHCFIAITNALEHCKEAFIRKGSPN